MSADRPQAQMQRRLAFALALVPYLLLVARFDFVCDDAYISFRYSRHMAQGAGLTFNPGEAPPVEGYSNFLWVVWLSLFERAGIAIELAARVSSIACGVGLLALLGRFLARRVAPRAQALCASLLFFALLPPVAIWSTSGLESMPFAFFCFAVFERLCGDRKHPHGLQAGLCAACAALLRADGVLWAGLMIAVASSTWFATRSRALRRAALTAGALLVLALLAHLAWRHAYYGEWLPNTARVKAGLSSLRLERGLDYVSRMLLALPLIAIVPLAVLIARGRPARMLALQAASVLACACAYSLYIGGDFMPMGRFLLVALPFLAILFAIAIARVVQSARTPDAATCTLWACALPCYALLVCANLGIEFVPRALRQRFHFRWNEARAQTEIEVWRGMRERALQWKELGRALALHTRPGEAIILGNVGAIGYESELFIHDIFGLVSPAVARRDAALVRASPGHDKAVAPDFFFKERPEYFNAYLARADAPLDEGLPAGWKQTSWGQRTTIERKALDPAQGFAPGLELRLLRMHWDQ